MSRAQLAAAVCAIVVSLPFPAQCKLGMPVPLTLTDRSGVARNNEGITTGVPIPQPANVTDVRNLMITTATSGSCEGGRIVDSMLTAAARWGGTPTDITKPIKWVWIEISGSVPANGQSLYCLADRTGADPGKTGLKVTQDHTFITIETGALTVKVRKDYFNFLDTVRAGSETIVNSTPTSKWSVTAGGAEYNSVNPDPSYRAVVEYPRPQQDANSAGETIRAQIKLSGRFTGRDRTQKLAYQFRLVTYADSREITIYPTIVFSEDCFAFRPENIALSLETQLGGTMHYTFGAADGQRFRRIHGWR